MACNTAGRTLIVSINYAVLEIWKQIFSFDDARTPTHAISTYILSPLLNANDQLNELSFESAFLGSRSFTLV